jgi:hypothetical protein
MAKEPEHKQSEPPRYEAGKGRAHPNLGPDAPANPNQSPPGQATGQSQKSQIAQYFRSQGKQPDDEILNIGGMKLTLKDLD